jgi:cytochrome c peroxidase
MCKKSAVLVIVLLFVICTGTAMAQTLSDEEELGKLIFNDRNLSINGNQSCAACHGLAAGWTGPETDINAGGAVYCTL